MKTKLTGLFICVMLLASAIPPLFISAQANDCSNGLAQRLSIGATGWVIPEPPQAVNVRDVPSGNLVGQIQPAETFIVLDGPTCDSTYSWWQVESENGVIGWIAEGVSDYFVEPLVEDTTADTESTSSQNGDCGNGLVQQLSIGITGQVPPESEIFPGTYTEPAGFPVGVLEPSQTFTVVDGPSCLSGNSWWQVETESGEIGWLREGGDDYSVVPLAVGGGSMNLTEIPLRDDNSVIIEDTSCETEPQFSVGDSISLVAGTSPVYYGHPLIEEGLFSVDAMRTYYDAFNEVGSFDFLYAGLEERRWYVVDGPYCVNNQYLVKLGVVGEVIDGIGFPVYTVSSFSAYYWYPEILVTEAEPIPIGASYDPLTYDLTVREAAPLIDPAQQVSFDGFGGGGSSLLPWVLPNCSVGDNISAINNITRPQIKSNLDVVNSRLTSGHIHCMEIYPISSPEVVVRIYQPDGTLYSEDTMQTGTATIIRELDRDVTNEIPVPSVQITLPDDFGLMTGIWQIEVVDGDTTTRRAYSLVDDTIQRIQSYCEGPHLKLWINEFLPQQSYDLVFIEQLPDSGGDRGVFLYEETDRWTVTTDDFGRLFFNVQFLPAQDSFFVVVPIGANWNESIDFVGNNDPGIFATHATLDCLFTTGNSTISENEFATGLGTFTYNGVAGETVNITASSFGGVGGIDDQDLILEIFAPDGSLLSRNDDANNAGYDPTDPEIESVVLPITGDYTVVLSGSDTTSGIGGLILESTSAPLIDEDVTIFVGEQTIGNLDEEFSLIFNGVQNDSISIRVSSDEFDPVITLQNEQGDVLVQDDDSGDGLDARIEYTIPDDGFYIIEVSSYSDKTGEYTIEVTHED